MADKVKAAFSKYDKDKNGFVSVDEARLVFLGEMGFNEDQAERLTLIYDRDGDGRLNYNEFAGFYELITNKLAIINLLLLLSYSNLFQRLSLGLFTIFL